MVKLIGSADSVEELIKNHKKRPLTLLEISLTLKERKSKKAVWNEINGLKKRQEIEELTIEIGKNKVTFYTKPKQ